MFPVHGGPACIPTLFNASQLLVSSISNSFRDHMNYSKYYKKVGNLTLVGVGPDIVRLLILLVHNGVLCGGGPGAQASLRVLSHVLVGFL